MTLPSNASLKYGLGVTRINDSGTWKPLTGMWINGGATWTPVKTAWVMRADGNWERVYPTPVGKFSADKASLSYTVYNKHTGTNKLHVTNIGDFDLTINSVTLSDSIGNFSTSMSGPSSVVLAPGAAADYNFTVLGNAVGLFSGTVNFNTFKGPLGNNTETIPVSTTVLADYASISTVGSISFSVYENDDNTNLNAAIQTFTIQNSGVGADLVISSIASQNGYCTIGGPAVSTVGYDFNTLNGLSTTFTVKPTSLAAGTFSDFIVITSNASNFPVLKIPVSIQVIRPSGSAAFTSPGVYSWTVPAHVYKLNFLAVGAGGGGGSGYTFNGGAGGGGGSGGYQYSSGVSVTPGETLTITVGDNGDGGKSTYAALFPVTLGYAWDSFMNSYAVWVSADGVNPVGTSPTITRMWTPAFSGNYTLTLAADNHADFRIDDTLIASSSSFTSETTASFSVFSGNRVIKITVRNDGGPAGVAATIKDSNNNIVWTTRTTLNDGVGSLGSSTTITGSFGTIAVTGGAPGGAATVDPLVGDPVTASTATGEPSNPGQQDSQEAPAPTGEQDAPAPAPATDSVTSTDSNDSSSGGSGSGGGCFLTTATVNALGLPDNCEELQLARMLRDSHVSATESGKDRVALYYSVAPQIVERFDGNWIDVYNQYIAPVTELIKENKHQEASKLYSAMCMDLFDKYGFKYKDKDQVELAASMSNISEKLPYVAKYLLVRAYLKYYKWFK